MYLTTIILKTQSRHSDNIFAYGLQNPAFSPFALRSYFQKQHINRDTDIEYMDIKDKYHSEPLMERISMVFWNFCSRNMNA